MSITFLQEPNAYKEIADVWWIGETITLDTTTKVYYFYFEAWWGLYRKDIYCEVYLTDEAHHPVGDPIATASDHLNAWEKHQVRERARFYFWGLIFEAGVEYFILIRDDEPTWHINSRIYIREDDSIYEGGMLYYSQNSGETWTEFPNDDIVFALTGTPEVPPPPPPAPIKNFAILDIEYTVTTTGLKIVVTTNVPCHLYCYWTAHEPQKHLIPILTRGTQLHTQLKMCFVDWTENEQEEPLDTLTHTFTKEPWATCETRWLTFRAKVMNEWVKSVGPIFKKHRVYAPPPPPVKSNDRNEVALAIRWWCQFWSAVAQSFTPDHNYNARRLSVMLCQYQPLYPVRGPFLVKLVETNTDCWLENILFSYLGYSTDLPNSGVKEWLDRDLPDIPLTLGKEYKVVCHTIAGWERFKRGVWAPYEAGAGMGWWGQPGNGDYTRGIRYYGCNFRDSGGVWSGQETVDATFILWE